MVNTIYDYGTATRTDLYEQAKEIAREQGITGISRYTKRELADFIKKYSEPVAETVTVKPITVEPAIVEFITVEPATVEPATVEPITVEPTIIEFITVEPATVKPASTNNQKPEDFAKQLVDHWRLSQQEHLPEADRKQLWQECFDMCDRLQSTLFAKYAESTVIKTLTPQYRKAIATEAGMLDPRVKGGYMYTAYPVAFWKVDQGARTEIDARTKVSTNKKKENAVRIPVECRENLLSTANDLLTIPSSNGQDIWRKALAISLLTGRRFYVEVCRNAQFFQLDEVIDFNRTLGFVGQAKGSIEKAEQVYEIPCYAENIDLLIKNTNLVQSFTKSKDWYSDDMEAKDFHNKIKSQCELALRVFNNICIPFGFVLTIKDLRSLYMAFCYYDYRVLSGRHPDMDSYIGSIAGHDVQTREGETYYRVGTTEHYKSFIDARWDN